MPMVPPEDEMQAGCPCYLDNRSKPLQGFTCASVGSRLGSPNGMIRVTLVPIGLLGETLMCASRSLSNSEVILRPKQLDGSRRSALTSPSLRLSKTVVCRSG